MPGETPPTHASPGDVSAPSGRRASLEHSYDDYPRIEESFSQYLDASLHPRGPDSLYDLVGSLGLSSDATVVDVGCGEGKDAVELARRFGLRVQGVDPVHRHIDLATALAGPEGVRGAVEFHVGSAEQLPFGDATVDLVWCKEVLMFADLHQAFANSSGCFGRMAAGWCTRFLPGRG